MRARARAYACAQTRSVIAPINAPQAPPRPLTPQTMQTQRTDSQDAQEAPPSAKARISQTQRPDTAPRQTDTPQASRRRRHAGSAAGAAVVAISMTGAPTRRNPPSADSPRWMNSSNSTTLISDRDFSAGGRPARACSRE